MWWLLDHLVGAFLMLMHAPYTALIGFAVMGVGVARLMPSGSVVRSALLGVAALGIVASGLAAAPGLVGAPTFFAIAPGH
jgi:hypothetical protein